MPHTNSGPQEIEGGGPRFQLYPPHPIAVIVSRPDESSALMRRWMVITALVVIFYVTYLEQVNSVTAQENQALKAVVKNQQQAILVIADFYKQEPSKGTVEEKPKEVMKPKPVKEKKRHRRISQAKEIVTGGYGERKN